jgi:hypothetical protein
MGILSQATLYALNIHEEIAALQEVDDREMARLNLALQMVEETTQYVTQHALGPYPQPPSIFLEDGELKAIADKGRDVPEQ